MEVVIEGVLDGMARVDLDQRTVRDINQFLHGDVAGSGVRRLQILNPRGKHSLAVGVDAEVSVDILGHAGYFVAGMNKRAHITVHGNVGWSFAENIMSGSARVKGNASECAGASGHGGLVVIEGHTSSRCGISLKGSDIVVTGDVGHASAFMAQAGRLVVCGNAGAGLGDSLYEAVIYVRGRIQSLGADARQEAMSDTDHADLQELLKRAGVSAEAREFKRIASARSLYHWNADAHQTY